MEGQSLQNCCKDNYSLYDKLIGNINMNAGQHHEACLLGKRQRSDTEGSCEKKHILKSTGANSEFKKEC